MASADSFHITFEAVLTCLLRFGAKDGKGGVLGRIKAYIGMTEEQKRLTPHCHLVLWVFGYNDFSSLRNVMDKKPGTYQQLAGFLSRVIFSQIASEADVRHAVRGEQEPTHNSESDRLPPPQNELERD